ncbi:conserved hypothetical protein [Leishmania mexicana MHOM/GT/2001/U1103]|uniref:Uncharacterized protein n=1 Tax=Leishmania mexicana (strain MHOM/GT/2001/U1103) TaxID=929439 RepID=E9B0H4_LEIMU|nr:conserved hypothetical protein [Leishmania mexicana MHOM/GT/2001/U1103]CBZ28728.1 conserved hypothetical protein [Leishmania mexicana MHOM/GT/2001/U1103]
MSGSTQRAEQQRRIQQLHERLELYNIADSHADPASNSAGGVGFAGTGGLQTGSGDKAPATKPSRAAPMLSSLDPKPTPAPASNAFFASSLPRRAADAGTPSATEIAEVSRASPAPQQQPQAQIPAPAPAPQLARNLAQEFCGSPASPTHASPTRAASRPSGMTSGAAASPVAPERPFATAAYPESGTEAAAATTAANAGSPRLASNVFNYYEDSKSDGSEGDEYEVEEVEEYMEDEEDYDDDEEDARDHTSRKGSLTLEDVLRRLHRACSGSFDHATASSPLGQAMAAASASSPLMRNPSLVSVKPAAAAAPRVTSTAAATNPIGATYPFLQQAAEVYRQRHLYKATQEQKQRHSPFNTGHAWSTDEETSVTDTSTSERTERLGDAPESRSASDSSSASAASKRHLAAANTTAAVQSSGLSAAALQPLADAAAATRTALDVASAEKALSSTALCFDQLETAYRRLLILQQGAKYVSELAGPECFPRPLPRQEDAHALAEQRDMVVRRDTEMRAAPPAGASLEDLRQRESAAIERTLGFLREKFDAALKSLKLVADREAVVEGKRCTLKQREVDIAKQREARVIVEREVAAAEKRLMERSEQLRKREEDYSARLQQHDCQQKAAQEQIGEVEQLSKQVSSWLAILEERDRRLARKEKRLQRVQADLLKRTEDIIVWKRATQRIKQIPPPPSPPRIS